MTRFLLAYVLPFLVPTLVYFAWRSMVLRRIAAGQPPEPESWHRAPWHWLALAGTALVAATLFTISFTTGSEPGGTYVPPRFEDGRIIPGHVIPATPAPEG